MKASVFVCVMAALTLICFSSGCPKSVRETRGGNHLREGEIDMPWDPPWHKPAPFDALFDRSDLIAFAEVVQVVDEKRRIGGEPPPPDKMGFRTQFRRQAGSIKVLRVLKGSQEYISKVINIEKKKSTYYLEVGRRRVFFLEMRDGQYHTLVRTFGPDWLGSALTGIKNLKLERGELNRGGRIVSVLSETLPVEEIEIHIFKGRLRAPVEIGDQSWEEHFIKTVRTDEFGIGKVELPNGRHTFLLELEGNLYSHHPGLVNGYYPSRIYVENNWRPIFFRLDEIVK